MHLTVGQAQLIYYLLRELDIFGRFLLPIPSRETTFVFLCVEVLWPSQPNGVTSSAVSLPNHIFTGQA